MCRTIVGMCDVCEMTAIKQGGLFMKNGDYLDAETWLRYKKLQSSLDEWYEFLKPKRIEQIKEFIQKYLPNARYICMSHCHMFGFEVYDSDTRNISYDKIFVVGEDGRPLSISFREYSYRYAKYGGLFEKMDRLWYSGFKDDIRNIFKMQDENGVDKKLLIDFNDLSYRLVDHYPHSNVAKAKEERKSALLPYVCGFAIAALVFGILHFTNLV